MTRSIRSLLAASAALLCAAPDAFAQYVPVQPPPQPVPVQPVPVQPPPAQAVPVQAAPPAQPQPALQSTAATLPRLQVAAFTGWQVNGDIDGIYGKLTVDDAQSFGVSLWSQVRPGTKVELLWIYSRTTARYDSYAIAYPSTK